QAVEGFRPYRHLPGSYPPLRWPRLYSVCGSTKLRTSLKMKGGTRYAHTTGCYNRKTTPGRRRPAGANRNSTAFSQLRRNRTKVTSTFRGLPQRHGPGELLALQSLVTEQLESTPTRQLVPSATETDDDTLTLGEVSRIAEENHRRFYNFQCRLAMLLEGWFETAEARSATLAHKGNTPFKNARDFQARLLGIDVTEVDRRMRIASANPAKPGASKTRAVKIQRAMADGRIDPSSANFIIDRLRSIRASAKRACSTDS